MVLHDVLHLPVFLTINPEQISNSICRNAAPNLAFCYSQIFSNVGSSVQRACCHLFCSPIPVFLYIVESLGLVSGLLLTVDGCTWVPLVSAGAELMALLDIFQCLREISLTCFTSKFPLPTTMSAILNVASFFVLLQKSLNSTS